MTARDELYVAILEACRPTAAVLPSPQPIAPPPRPPMPLPIRRVPSHRRRR